ncbi:hypothetical protein [Pseudoalteromonas sp. Of7M-16]|uniref:hypothetical protein n=1 Tax=Pseudoalteromonas sp. Of7M-16 TaxID=2917756 RepID=UPI001EF60CB6|nr:hypothetical protein [Pseudoalteromonas sp. Of7M-16]MCG7548204.1 hypothetical protein [Pseudoalteromonas sp. Of7M-16]
MFSYENYKAFYDSVAFFITPIYFISLIVGWRSINTRMLIISLLTLEAIDNLLTDWSYTLGSNYGFYAIFVCAVFSFAIIGRRLLAKWLGNYIRFCNDVYQNYYFSKQEAALFFMSVLLMLFHIIALVEVKLYQYQLIASYPYRINLFPLLLTVSHLLAALTILRLAIRRVPVDIYVKQRRTRAKLNEGLESSSRQDAAQDKNQNSQ